MSEQRDWTAVFDKTFSHPESSVEDRIWRDVYADEYPEGLGTYSYISRTELARFVDELRVGEGELLGDVGCGRGGPGLWVTAQSGARLVGVDISEAALEAASARARSLGLDERSEWRLGSFEAMRLDDQSLDAAMSVDALSFSPDKEAAIREFARVLRSGSRLVMTTWDYHSQPKGRPLQVSDHRPLLDSAGFEVLAYEETVDWRRRQLATTDGLLAAVDELALESGEDRDQLVADLLEMRAVEQAIIARRLIVAERR